jgi:ADP-ribose pyrophosphatase
LILDINEMHLVSRHKTRLSPYVTLVERNIQLADSVQVYHGLELADYVSILAVTVDGMVPLVRQYRPALERETLELPGGLLDSKASAEEIARNELYEETGYRVGAQIDFLGSFDPDPGRLGNRFWAFFARDVVRASDWQIEPGVNIEFMPLRRFLATVRDGEFSPALHVALVGMVILKGLIDLELVLGTS